MISGRSAATSLAKSHRPSAAPSIIRSTSPAAVALDRGGQRRDRAGGERARQQPPQPGVVRRVHVQHHPADPLEVLRVADLRRAQPGGEGGRVAQHPLHLGVPQHQPEARALREAVQRRFLDPGDRAGVAEPPQRLERRPGLVGRRGRRARRCPWSPPRFGDRMRHACLGRIPAARAGPVRLLARGHLPGVRPLDAGPQGARSGVRLDRGDAAAGRGQPRPDRVPGPDDAHGPARSRTPTTPSTSSTCSSQDAAARGSATTTPSSTRAVRPGGHGRAVLLRLRRRLADAVVPGPAPPAATRPAGRGTGRRHGVGGVVTSLMRALWDVDAAAGPAAMRDLEQAFAAAVSAATPAGALPTRRRGRPCGRPCCGTCRTTFPTARCP